MRASAVAEVAVLDENRLRGSTSCYLGQHRSVYIYLTMTVGPRAGMSQLLDSEQENRIGRDLECAITLDDPLCSRVHATIEEDGGVWRIRDEGSRNGTFVNDQKIDDAVLA